MVLPEVDGYRRTLRNNLLYAQNFRGVDLQPPTNPAKCFQIGHEPPLNPRQGRWAYPYFSRHFPDTPAPSGLYDFPPKDLNILFDCFFHKTLA